VDHREQQIHIAARANEQMLIRCGCGLRVPRVDHDQTPAARAKILQPALHVRRGHNAALGDDRVPAENEKEVAAIDIRYGQHAATEHQAGGNHLRKLIHRDR